MAQTPVKLGTFQDLMLDRQIEELVSYARSVAESTSGTAEAPTTISAITTAGGFGHVRLEYSYTSYNSHKYTEIWRSADTTFANAERVGATAAHFYQDFPPNPQISEVLYYWVRNVNMDDAEGDLFGPVAGSVGSDPEYNLDMLIGQLGFWHLQPGTLPVRSEPTFPTLPSVLYPVNSRIYLTTNQIVYKNVNEAWVEDLSPEIAFKIIAGQIAAGALVVDDGVMQNGYIKNAHIADATIDNAKINTLDGGKITANSITASKYNELRNSLIFNGWDSLDASFPFEVPFLLLSELTAIQSVKLSFKIMPYRGYSTGTSSGGSSVPSTTAVAIPTHNHTFKMTGNTYTSGYTLMGDATTGLLYLYKAGGATSGYYDFPFESSDGHTHNVSAYYTNSTTGKSYVSWYADSNTLRCPNLKILTTAANNHSHEFDLNGAYSGTNAKIYLYGSSLVSSAASGTEYASQTSESASNHTHTVTIPNHTHGIAFGIFEESNSPSVTVNIDNGSGYGTPLGFAGDQLNLDLTSRLSGAGWKTLKFTSSARCRIAFVLECKLDISA